MADDEEEPRSMTVKERLALMKKQAEDAKAAKEAAAIPAPKSKPVRRWTPPTQGAVTTSPENSPSTFAATVNNRETSSSTSTSVSPPSSVFSKDSDESNGTSSVSKLAAGLAAGIKFGTPSGGFRLPGMDTSPSPVASNAASLSSPPLSSSGATEASPGEITHVNLSRPRLSTPRKRSTSTKLKLADLESAGISIATPDDTTTTAASAENV